MGLDWGGLGSVATAGMGLAKKGIDNYQDLKNNQLTDQMANTTSQLLGDQPGSNLAHANHPVWDFISKLGGGGKDPSAAQAPLLSQGIPTTGDPLAQAQMAKLAAMNSGSPIAVAQPGMTGQGPMGAMTGMMPQQGLPTGPMGIQSMANGGIVAGNFGSPTMLPNFVQGPMQGIVPASTRGQILTMADGGYVPGAEISVPMNGRGAAAIAGLQAGQNIGHNFQQQWQDNAAREAKGQDAANSRLYGVDNTDDQGNPIPFQPPKSLLGQATDAVETFAHHIKQVLLPDSKSDAKSSSPNVDPTKAANQVYPNAPVDPTTAGNRIFPVPGQPVALPPFPSDNKGIPVNTSQVASPPPGAVSGVPAGSIKDRQIQLTQQLRDSIGKGNDSLATMGFSVQDQDRLANKLGITATTKFTPQEAQGLAGQLLENDPASRQGTRMIGGPSAGAAPGSAPDGAAPPGPAAGADGAPPAGAPAGPGAAPAGALPAGPALPGPAGAAPAGAPAAPGAGPAGAPPAGAGTSPAGAPASAIPATAAAADANSLKAPATADGQPHSVKSKWWAHSNQLMANAAYLAAKAGEDPYKVLDSSAALRTSVFQGEVLRWSSDAAHAFQAGDMPRVARALHNINFYLPDDKGIDVKYATADEVKMDPTHMMKEGDMIHSNPYQNMYGHEKDSPWIKVDLPYLNSLGHGALDTSLMEKTLIERYAASAKAESEIRTGRGAELRGGGIERSGIAAEAKANTERELAPAKNSLLNEQAGQASRSPVTPATAAGAAPKMTWSVYNATKNRTAALADSLQLGQKVPVPETIPDPRHPGKMMPNTEYAPGKMMMDPSKIPPILRGISDEDRPRLNSMAGEFHAANMGRISDYDAIDLAARYIKDQRAAPKDRVHEDPSTVKPPNAPGSGKKLKNVFHSSDGRIHIWVGPKPMDYKTIRERAEHDNGNSSQPGIPTSSNGAAGESSAQPDEPDQTAMLDASSGP